VLSPQACDAATLKSIWAESAMQRISAGRSVADWAAGIEPRILLDVLQRCAAVLGPSRVA
jgi:hypothetical protein